MLNPSIKRLTRESLLSVEPRLVAPLPTIKISLLKEDDDKSKTSVSVESPTPPTTTVEDLKNPMEDFSGIIKKNGLTPFDSKVLLEIKFSSGVVIPANTVLKLYFSKTLPDILFVYYNNLWRKIPIVKSGVVLPLKMYFLGFGTQPTRSELDKMSSESKYKTLTGKVVSGIDMVGEDGSPTWNKVLNLK